MRLLGKTWQSLWHRIATWRQITFLRSRNYSTWAVLHYFPTDTWDNGDLDLRDREGMSTFRFPSLFQRCVAAWLGTEKKLQWYALSKCWAHRDMVNVTSCDKVQMAEIPVHAPNKSRSSEKLACFPLLSKHHCLHSCAWARKCPVVGSVDCSPSNSEASSQQNPVLKCVKQLLDKDSACLGRFHTKRRFQSSPFWGLGLPWSSLGTPDPQDVDASQSRVSSVFVFFALKMSLWREFPQLKAVKTELSIISANSEKWLGSGTFELGRVKFEVQLIIALVKSKGTL